ncbi:MULTISPECIES: lipopolysaccharide assembly LapA domain-containing protein [unclassified Brevibacterium]|uniref:LapA family protein n=1 Tax=unclassified Brevibacterium TaxID=2614124 RepID=UPI0008A14C92|nr:MULTISPECIES: LapA family protein [unclassified Brevibacterium]OFL65263.1 hypothetical protein HMPREF2757_05150 [Brevibacterium sp. HMSC063G07]OFS25186.1 hypothetical protein HMPREF3162_09730 [Brevibacterium sp. HMSC07C04]
MTQPNGDHSPVPESSSPETVEQAAETAPQQAQTPAQSQAQTPPPAVKASGGLSAGIWASLIIGALILVLLLIFIIQNNEPTQFYYFGWEFTLPLGVSILLAAIAGIVIAGIFGTVRMFILGRQIKRANKR